jgi:acyl-CoA synthetase (AMP-forming)/AMP-acid ligase II
LPNRVELPIALLGALKAGVVAVPVNWRLLGPELARVIDHCAPACLLTTAEKAPALAGSRVPPPLLVGDEPFSGTFWSELRASGPQFDTIACQSTDIAHLLYTSGTTATPKAAIHTHGMRVAIAAAMADCFKLSSRDVGLAISPMFHTAGISVFSNAIFAGCKLVMLEKWDLEDFLSAIERERVTFMHLISTIVVDIARAPDHHFHRDTRSMRFTWGGGHNVDPVMLETFERRVGGVLLQGYSRTEGGLTYNPLDPARRRFDSHGFPNRNSSEVAIIDPATQRICAPGETGEIAVRGDGVSPGYWDGEFVRARAPYDGGWQPTGDLGFFEEGGALHFLGRYDHMIKTGGENVYPAEIERVLMSDTRITEAAVVRAADQKWGEVPVAFVSCRDATVTEAYLLELCRRDLAAYKRPRQFQFIDVSEFPRSTSGKVQRHELEARLAKGAP